MLLVQVLGGTSVPGGGGAQRMRTLLVWPAAPWPGGAWGEQSRVRTSFALCPCTINVRPSRRAPAMSTLLTDAPPSAAQPVPVAVLPDTSMRLPAPAARARGCAGSTRGGWAFGRLGWGVSAAAPPAGPTGPMAPVGPTGPTGPIGPAACAAALARSSANSTAPRRRSMRRIGPVGPMIEKINIVAPPWFGGSPSGRGLAGHAGQGAAGRGGRRGTTG